MRCRIVSARLCQSVSTESSRPSGAANLHDKSYATWLRRGTPRQTHPKLFIDLRNGGWGVGLVGRRGTSGRCCSAWRRPPRGSCRSGGDIDDRPLILLDLFFPAASSEKQGRRNRQHKAIASQHMNSLHGVQIGTARPMPRRTSGREIRQTTELPVARYDCREFQTSERKWSG